jgi:hypothetical protein
LILTGLPTAARRLFPGYDEAELAKGGAFVIGRLLEDGDGADLAWLCETVPEEELAAWLERHGGRKLSRRSRAFWELVLTVDPSLPSEAGDLLWPL